MTARTWQREPSVTHSGWKTTWKLKDILSDDEDSRTVAIAARAIHDRIETLRKTSFGGEWASDTTIADISDEFHTIGYVDGDERADLDHFNLVMDALYDWADWERVIIGGERS